MQNTSILVVWNVRDFIFSYYNTEGPHKYKEIQACVWLYLIVIMLVRDPTSIHKYKRVCVCVWERLHLVIVSLRDLTSINKYQRVCVCARASTDGCRRIIATGLNSEAEKMATQREEDAADYLKEHKIMELMDNLTSMLFFYRPG